VTDKLRETVSVVIPTRNAAHLLKDSLASVAWTDEIIVVDMFSTDETEVVCAEYPQCRLVQRDDYIEGNVNFGLDQASCDWVMRLDTDERITPELAEEIQELLTAPPESVTGFEFWERPVMLGRELTSGFGSKHYRQMLFRRGAARYPARTYHEGFETSGTWVRGTHGYLHYNYCTVRQYLDKTNFYTDGDVHRAALPPKSPGVTGAAREPLRAFYLYYLKRRGYRDGWVGLVDAGMRAFYQFVYWAKLRERWERERGGHGAP
jgi:glycosyltransferase involved in cell wall biosynthesis